jgi:hypothetical protein
VLHRPREPVLLARDAGEILERLEVERDVLIDPSASTTPPCDVDCTEILESPTIPGAFACRVAL